jgi:hypothetical protein
MPLADKFLTIFCNYVRSDLTAMNMDILVGYGGRNQCFVAAASVFRFSVMKMEAANFLKL